MGQALNYQVIDTTLESTVVKPSVAIIRTQAELQRLWRANVPDAAPLAVNFDQELLYAFFSGRGGRLVLPASVRLYPQWLTISLPPADAAALPADAPLRAPAWLMRLPKLAVSQLRIQGAGVVEFLR